jgi:hypothetical protein
MDRVFIATKYESFEIPNVNKIIIENDVVTASKQLYIFFDNMTKKYKISLDNILLLEVKSEAE